MLGHFEFFGLPKTDETIPVSITYRYNANGIVEVEACQTDQDAIFSHRVAKDKYGLDKVLNRQVPANIAVILDSSGSMYGEPMSQARGFIQQFATDQLTRKNRNMALYSYPEGLLGKPTNQSSVISQQLKRVMPIGFSMLQVELKRAKEHLKGRSGVVVLVSDGHIPHIEDVKRVINAIHRMGCVVFVVGVGEHRNEEVLKSLCNGEQYYRSVERELDISKYLIKLLKHT